MERLPEFQEILDAYSNGKNSHQVLRSLLDMVSHKQLVHVGCRWSIDSESGQVAITNDENCLACIAGEAWYLFEQAWGQYMNQGFDSDPFESPP